MGNENMRKDLNDKGLWSPKSIMIIGSLVSFFIAGIMSAINYGRLGYADKKKKLILTITIGYIASICLSIIIGEKIDLTTSWASVNIGVSAVLKSQQEKLYKDYIKNGGKKASLKTPLIWSTIVLLLTFGIGPAVDYYYIKTGRYEGNIENGFAKSYYKNGNIEYEGYFLDYSPNGKGKSYYGSGKLQYEGNFKDRLPHGKGKGYYENENVAYEGNFKDGIFHGKGKLYYENGNVLYEGDFKNDLAHGNGKLYYKNGSLEYDGDFKNDTFDGQGKLYDENGNLFFEGELIDGEPINGKAYDKTGNLIKEGNVKGMFD